MFRPNWEEIVSMFSPQLGLFTLTDSDYDNYNDDGGSNSIDNDCDTETTVVEEQELQNNADKLHNSGSSFSRGLQWDSTDTSVLLRFQTQSTTESESGFGYPFSGT